MHKKHMRLIRVVFSRDGIIGRGVNFNFTYLLAAFPDAPPKENTSSGLQIADTPSPILAPDSYFFNSK
jgi:hypothetical protein